MAEPIYHCSLVEDWAAARAAGEYTVSTRGRTLAQEGYLHASYAGQVTGVLARFYADVTEPMVLLVIDPDRLTVPVVPESPPGAQEKFPHIYGPLTVDAVVEVRPLRRGDSGWISPSLVS
ncbi:DUF952 domain-containing protein [Nakamurella sp.]|uniref:DUF952 domain-containing protein n=1 Tax=Nakamurella sp. TaxID=1869182 RepID=UPI00378423D3